jgi:hypothetical protein
MSSGTEPGSWGKDAVVQWVSTPYLVCEVLDTETECEQAEYVSDTRRRQTSV